MRVWPLTNSLGSVVVSHYGSALYFQVDLSPYDLGPGRCSDVDLALASGGSIDRLNVRQ